MQTLAGLVLVAFLVSGAPASAQTAAPWFGTWRLATPPAADNDTPFKRVTVSIEPWDDGLRVVYDMVRLRGGVAHLEWRGRFDGQPRPLEGLDEVVANAYRRVNDRSYDVLQMSDSSATSTTRVVISADGQTMTTVSTTRDGRKQTSTYVRLPD